MKNCLLLLLILNTFISFAQFPYNNPLLMTWSSDGITFNTPSVFQDSSGVPSVIKWKGDTLIAAFQWFRAPNPSPTWDRVAVKFSYDNGITWSAPSPIVVNGLPAGYQRPFDPSLAVTNGDSIRIYFSSGYGMPQMGLDSSINTYSAISADGINYNFESFARVDDSLKKVIDPSVIYFNNGWHYIAPVGAPQEGAWHFVSPDGIHFSKVPDIPSDIFHNWTGNLMIDDTSEMRFYGCSQGYIWFNVTQNGGTWNGYVNTNITGGDPAVVKISASDFLMIYVGPPYTTGISEYESNCSLEVYPNPAKEKIIINDECGLYRQWNIYDSAGRMYLIDETGDISHLPNGKLLLQSTTGKSIQFIKAE